MRQVYVFVLSFEKRALGGVFALVFSMFETKGQTTEHSNPRNSFAIMIDGGMAAELPTN